MGPQPGVEIHESVRTVDFGTRRQFAVRCEFHGSSGGKLSENTGRGAIGRRPGSHEQLVHSTLFRTCYNKLCRGRHVIGLAVVLGVHQVGGGIVFWVGLVCSPGKYRVGPYAIDVFGKFTQSRLDPRHSTWNRLHSRSFEAGHASPPHPAREHTLSSPCSTVSRPLNCGHGPVAVLPFACLVPGVPGKGAF